LSKRPRKEIFGRSMGRDRRSGFRRGRRAPLDQKGTSAVLGRNLCHFKHPYRTVLSGGVKDSARPRVPKYSKTGGRAMKIQAKAPRKTHDLAIYSSESLIADVHNTGPVT